MADQPEQADSTAETRRERFSKAARGWSTVALAFVGVLAIAVFLLRQHQQRREDELTQHHARSAARIGKQIELRYENYRQLVANVTRTLASAQSVVENERLEKLNRARESVREKNEQAGLIQARLSAARERSTTARGESSKLQAALDEAKRTEREKLERAAGEAAVWMSLLEAADAADASRKIQLTAAAKAQAEVDAARARLDQAPPIDIRPQSPAAPAPSATPSASAGAADDAPQTADAGARAPAPVDGARSRREAEAALGRAEQALSTAQDELAAAERDADRAWLAALHANDRADESWEQTAAASNRKAEVGSAADKAKKAGATAEAAATKAATEVDASRQEAARASAAAESLAADTGPTAAEAFRRRVGRVVLPSYRSEIEECPTAAGLAATTLCAARAIARMNAAHGAERGRGLEFVECTALSDGLAPDLATLSPDGRFVLLPTGEASGMRSRVCGRVAVADLVAPNGGAAPFGAFAAVALLTSDGTAIHAPEAGSSVRIAKLPGVDAKAAAASTALRDVPLGGEKFRAFLQPVKVKLATVAECSRKSEPCEASGATSERSDLVLAGVVRELDLGRASLEISLSSYLWVVLLLGMGILSLPLAKLWLLGAGTSFRRFDVTLFATSALVTSLLSAVLLLSFVAHNALWKRAGSQTESVAGALAGRIQAEVEAAGEALEKFETNPGTSRLAAVITDSTELLEQIELAHECDETLDGAWFTGACERSGFIIPDVSGEKWNLAFLANGLGYQQAKFVPSGHASTPINVASRDYFRRALNDETACMDRGCTRRAVAEIVRSATSGDIVLLASKRVATARKSSGVAAIETPLDGFRHLVLPLGFQAIVTDREGKVVLHSENEAAHGQPIFPDVDEPTELRAVLANQVPDSVELRYLGAQSRIQIQPVGLRGLGWTVLVVAPVGIVDVATTDMVLLSLFGMGALVAFCLFAACSGVIAKRFVWLALGRSAPGVGPARGVHLRPDGRRSEQYASAGLWMFRWAAVLCLVALGFEQHAPVTVQLGVWALVAWSALRRTPGIEVEPPPIWRWLSERLADPTPTGQTEKAPRPARAEHDSWRDRLPLTYTLCCMGLTSLFVVVPATVIFAAAHDHVADTLVRAEQHDFSDKLRFRDECLVAGTKRDSCRNVFPANPASLPTATAPSELVNWMLSPLPYLADYLPPFGSSEVQSLGRVYRSETRGSAPGGAHAAEYELRRKGGWLALTSTLGNGAAVSSVELPSLLTTDFQWPKLLLLVLIFTAFFAGSAALAYESLNRLFFLDLLEPRVAIADPIDGYAPELTGKKLFLFHGAGVENELREKWGFGDLPPDPARVVGTTERGWLVAGLEDLLASKDEVARIAAAGKSAIPAVLLSEAEPLRRAPGALRRDWAEALANFQVLRCVRETTPPLGASLAVMVRTWEECDEREQQLLAQLVLDGYANPHRANHDTVEHLVHRGILDVCTLTLANDGFADVVRRSVTGDQQRKWQDSDRGTAWQALRVPLSTAVFALFGALTVSKPELGAVSALVPTLAAGLPSVVKALLEMAKK